MRAGLIIDVLFKMYMRDYYPYDWHEIDKPYRLAETSVSSPLKMPEGGILDPVEIIHGREAMNAAIGYDPYSLSSRLKRGF